MRVAIGADKCQGHQMCAIRAPELFDSDDEGQGVVIGDGEVPPELEDAAYKAESSCPEQAITVEK